MQTVTVSLNSPTRGYSIYVGSGLIDRAGSLMSEAGLRYKAVVITDTTVGRLYGERLKRSYR